MEKLVFNKSEYTQMLFEQIAQARKSILVSCYILESDEFGSRVIAALKVKSGEGVLVRVVVDGYGSWAWVKACKEDIENERFRVRVFHPIPWPLSKLRISHIPRLDRFFRFLLGINQRNHQKLFVFDEERMLIGSRNLHNDALTWRETSLLIAGGAVKSAVSIFDSVWRRSHERMLSRVAWSASDEYQELPPCIMSNHLFKLRREKNRIIRERIRNARSNIYLTTPYLFPSKLALSEVLSKAEQGVDIRILLPRSSDVWISKWIAQLHYRVFLDAGIKIYEYRKNVLHAKSVIIDEWALVGSSNFNRRSAFQDLEIDYVPSESGTLRKLEEQFIIDLENADRVTGFQQIGFLKYAIAWMVSKLFPSWF